MRLVPHNSSIAGCFAAAGPGLGAPTQPLDEQAPRRKISQLQAPYLSPSHPTQTTRNITPLQRRHEAKTTLKKVSGGQGKRCLTVDVWVVEPSPEAEQDGDDVNGVGANRQEERRLSVAVSNVHLD